MGPKTPLGSKACAVMVSGLPFIAVVTGVCVRRGGSLSSRTLAASSAGVAGSIISSALRVFSSMLFFFFFFFFFEDLLGAAFFFETFLGAGSVVPVAGAVVSVGGAVVPVAGGVVPGPGAVCAGAPNARARLKARPVMGLRKCMRPPSHSDCGDLTFARGGRQRNCLYLDGLATSGASST